jgi:DNA-binding Lrp family transcriptional regulator
VEEICVRDSVLSGSAKRDEMVDRIDRKILNELYVDSDRSRKVIGKLVALSEPSLSKKIAMLRAEKVIKNFSVDIDYESVGFNTNSVTLIRIHDAHKDKQTALVQKIAKINEAIEVYMILGPWDVYVRWLCKSNARVMEIINDKLLSDESVAHTETITLGVEFKRVRGPLLSETETT